MSHHPTPRFGFVFEQILGHATHARSLRRILSEEESLDPVFFDVEWDLSGWSARIPVFNSNWTVRSGLRARRGIRQMVHDGPLEALFIHTQVPAVFCQSWMKRIPTVVSIDATPLQYDELGEHYDHASGNPRLERLKWQANRACFERAAHLVSWSAWAKQGLIDGYGVDADKITVIPPGVRPSDWARRPPRSDDLRPVRILFVGGDLERKGGDLLLRAFGRLRAEISSGPNAPGLELHLVTRSDVPSAPGVTVHRGLAPASPELVALYHACDVFCLPTRGDCLPMVLSEAAAAGLPLVSTAVAGIPEIVREGDTGLVVPVGDEVALGRALRVLVDTPDLRARLGDAARQLAERDYDAEKNARQLVELLTDVADRSPAPQGVTHHAPMTHSLRSSIDGSARVLLTVSGTIPADIEQLTAAGLRPRPDYLALAAALNADLLDVGEARRQAGRAGRVLERIGGPGAVLAWASFRARHRYDVVVTDGEQVGLPLALLRKLTRRRTCAHVMIADILSVPKKVLVYRLLRPRRQIDTMLVYSSWQQRFISEELGYPADQVVWTPFAVDCTFFASDQVPSNPEAMICTAGLERRDYRTLIEAVRGLDVRVVIAAASPWSTQHDTTKGAQLPANVEVCSLGFLDLRQLYADAQFVVMPLADVEFQAGVTTILEAMAMSKAVVCSRTRGQTDVLVQDTTGIYVTPGDSGELRTAIIELLGDPARAKRMGIAGREQVERDCDVAVYAERLARVVATTMEHVRA